VDLLWDEHPSADLYGDRFHLGLGWERARSLFNIAIRDSRKTNVG
jgi:hypothetical protein